MINIKKRILSGVVAGIFVLLPGLKGKAEIRETNNIAINNREVLVYNRDDINSQVIGKLRINEKFIRVLIGENLDLINYHNHLGFIQKDAIDIKSFTDLDGAIYQEIYQDGYTTSKLNFRVGPGVNYDLITTIENESMLTIIAKSSNGWLLVSYNDMLGFVSSDYVKIIDYDRIQEQAIKLPTIYKALITTTGVNLREEPNVNSKKITTLKQGEKLVFIKKLDNGWYECLYNNTMVYVCGDYVKEIYAINGEYYSIVYFKNDSFAYDFPFGNVIGNIPKYEIAFVYGETDCFYLIETEGRVGYVKKGDCKVLKDKYVVVDISSQTMTLYNGIYEVLSSSVVTGKNITPTHLGCYSIHNKEENRSLIGEGYKSFVQYWMPFNGGEGLHDASWRSHFGGNIYKKSGSHGCVNLPIDIAEQLYNEVSIGDKVLIKK